MGICFWRHIQLWHKSKNLKGTNPRDYLPRVSVTKFHDVEISWSSSRAVSLVSMFRDASLSSDEMNLVVEKIGDVIKKLKPDEVPPLVYQVDQSFSCTKRLLVSFRLSLLRSIIFKFMKHYNYLHIITLNSSIYTSIRVIKNACAHL